MKKIALLFPLLASMFTGISQSNNVSNTPVNTLLWKITGNGLKKPSYLFGTMHILCADDAKLNDSLKSVIKNCDEVYFEIDLSDMKGMMNSLKFMRMADNKRLSDVLNAEDYAKVKKYFDTHSTMLPFSMLERFKPMFISSMVEEGDLDCKNTNGMEMVIMSELHQWNKKINGLETAEFQAGLFDSIPYEKQAKDLVNYLDSSAEYKKMTDSLVVAYRNADLAKIDEMTTKEDPSMVNYLDLMLYGRNRNWVGKMKTILPGESLLFAVGAGHLPGNQGLINLLRKNGYTVSPVKDH